jgi:uncharacterized membrane protein
MISSRVIGILWALAGLVLLLITFGREPRSTPLLVAGVVFVALGAALIRRSSRGGGRR